MTDCQKCKRRRTEKGLDALSPCPKCGATLQEEIAIADNQKAFIDKSGFIITTDSTVTKEQIKKAFEEFSEEDIIETTLFEYRLWHKYSQNGRRKGDLTRNYFNPFKRIQFIGFEGTKFRFLPKDIPLPKGWKVIIRNIWDEKYAYEYPSGRKILLDSEEYDKLENPFIFSRLEWCLSHRVDFMTIDKKVYGIMEKCGEVPKGFVDAMLKALI